MTQSASENNSSNGSRRRVGIIETIRHADSQDEINNLLKRLASADYANASNRTRAKCQAAARKRRKELTNDR